MNIIIVGGGAGGLELVVALAKKYRHDNEINIILVDQTLSHIWKPLLHDVAGGTLNNIYDEMSYLDLAQKNHFEFELGKITKIDRQRKIIFLKNPNDADQKNTLSLSYEILILAIGSITNNFNTPGSDQYCYYLDNESQAKKLRYDLLKKLIDCEYEKKNNPITIAIVGGGATGIELAAELHTSLSAINKLISKNNNNKNSINITVIEASSRILPPLPEYISNITQKKLSESNITVLTNTRVIEIKKEGLTTHNNEFISADFIVWSAGIKGHDIARELSDFELSSSGQIRVKATLQTTIDDHIFAFGDCAFCLMPNGKPVPARAQSAHQQASMLKKSILLMLKKKALPEYRYIDYGSLVSLSHNGTLGALTGGGSRSVFIQGIIARIIYLLLYKSHQIRILGYWKVGVMTIANFLTRRVRSPMKLH